MSEGSLTKAVTVRTFKYDGTEHRHWSARIQRREGSLIVLDAAFETEIVHNILGTIACGTLSTEYYWLDRWYNIFRFAGADGALRNYYCNINVPPVLNEDTLRYIDLDIDVLVAPDLSYQILDFDEFEANAQRFGYSRDITENAVRALNELIELIQAREFPFD